MNCIYILTGVNGVGKTTLVSQLENTLDKSTYEVHDFDERGVPDNAGREWRQSETRHWIQTGKESAKSLVVCGFMKPTEIERALSKLGVTARVCLLDADAETITRRILGRYQTSDSVAELRRTTQKTPQKFAEDSVWVSAQFRQEAKEKGYMILDTSTLGPEEVGVKITKWILSCP